MHVMIVGTRGVPAGHGGFETFAEDLSLFLVARNHQVTVYCQVGDDQPSSEDWWNGVRRVLIPAANNPVGTIMYDWDTTMHAARSGGVVLTLGYNTAAFSLAYRLRRVPNVMNMDGIEWKRAKWSFSQRCWLWLNEWAGSRLANRLVADHPEIAKHLCRHTAARKIATIPYGANAVSSAPEELLEQYQLQTKGYYLVIARAEPENSILEIVKAFSSCQADVLLIVLGTYSVGGGSFQREVLAAAGDNVKFLGAIYDRRIVSALRFHAKAYIHGHQVGGTNPSLVEALAAGNAIVAHDNRFTRWVAGEGARYFAGARDLEAVIRSLEQDPPQLVAMESYSRERHATEFGLEKSLTAYESLLQRTADGQR
jgi:glycosyltransferase involved in cell wall biosynthesis